MTNREKRPSITGNHILALVMFVFCLVSVYLTSAEARHFFEIRTEIARYQNLLENEQYLAPDYLTKLKSHANSLRENELTRPEPEPIPSLSDTIATVRASLYDNQIPVERFQISGRGQNEVAEFVLRTTALSFFRFLEQTETTTAFSIVSMNIRGAAAPGATIEVDMRVRHAD
jgi:hypothetical protein